MDDVWLTSYKTGETLCNFSFNPGDVVVGDSIYGMRSGIAHVKRAGAEVIVRIKLQGLPLIGSDEKPFDILRHARGLADGEIAEWDVTTVPCEGIGSIPGRLIIIRLEHEPANRAKRRAKRKRQKNSSSASDKVLEACEYIFLFTTLTKEQAGTRDIADIFRFRWQIELEFKRLKSLIGFSDLLTHTDDSCRIQLLGKILSALIIEELMRGVTAFSPWDSTGSVLGPRLCSYN
jgi:hypothetical protein